MCCIKLQHMPYQDVTLFTPGIKQVFHHWKEGCCLNLSFLYRCKYFEIDAS